MHLWRYMPRAVLLASRDALALVNAEQFSALEAHELAHEYVWEEYWRAMQSGEHSRMQRDQASLSERRCLTIAQASGPLCRQ
jgi:predicted SprT family Zn-dependent metalloprotease